MTENENKIKEQYEINGEPQVEIKNLVIDQKTGFITKVIDREEQDLKGPVIVVIPDNRATISNGKIILSIADFRPARKRINIPLIPKEKMWNYQAPIPEEYTQRIKKNPDWPLYYNDYLRQLHKNGTFPKFVKEIIQVRKTITKNELVEIIKAHGYREAGNLSATLNVLEKVTRQIVKEGHRNNQKITWLGTIP